MKRYPIYLFILLFSIMSVGLPGSASSVHPPAEPGLIETIAGSGTPGYSGDGGPAVFAKFGVISDLVVDSAGNIFVSDTNNHCIRRIDHNGIITTVAGTGVPGFNGDQRPATSAQLAAPAGITVDGQGNLYIADIGNHRIRQVDATGMISTIAGNGTRGFGGDGGPALAANFNYPAYIALDAAGNFYVSDVGNYRIRRIDPDGVITTIAGDGRRGSSGDGGPAQDARFKDVGSLVVAPDGQLLVVDRYSHRVRQILQNGVIDTLAGNGFFGYNGDDIPATQASMRYPQDVAVDQAGDVYIADFSNHRVRRVDANGMISTFAGLGNAGFNGDGIQANQAALNSPSAVAVDRAGNFYIADSFNYRIRMVRMN